jgi:hypothetical protein
MRAVLPLIQDYVSSAWKVYFFCGGVRQASRLSWLNESL